VTVSPYNNRHNAGVIMHIKRMKKYIIVLTLFFLMIFSVGCSQTTNTVKNFRTGTSGLVIEFFKDNPSSVYEREEFGTALIIKNAGSTDITTSNPAELRINFDSYRMYGVGGYFDEQTLTTSRYTTLEILNIAINGKNQYYPIGDEKAAAFYFVSNSLTELREGATTKISYNLCYPYSTILATMTCIDTKGHSNDFGVDACTSEIYNGAIGQGGPIVITRVEPEILLQNGYVRPQFKIFIENKGNGYVTSNRRCGEVNLNDREYSGRVNVEATLSGQRLECGPDNSGSLRLVDSESFIRCSLSQDNDRYPMTQKNYITPLTVSVYYTYTSTEEIELEIKRNDLLEDNESQGLCGIYEREYNNRCITKCEFCALNPNDDACDNNLPQGFTFNSNFKCSCDLATCNTKQDRGNCIKGYCPAGSNCCTTNTCDQYQIEYHGQCIDKCAYCNINATDAAICRGLDFTGFTCKTMNSTQCTALRSSCRSGYCGGTNIGRFCSNSTDYS